MLARSRAILHAAEAGSNVLSTGVGVYKNLSHASQGVRDQRGVHSAKYCMLQLMPNRSFKFTLPRTTAEWRRSSEGMKRSQGKALERQ